MSKVGYFSLGYPGEMKACGMMLDKNDIRRVIDTYREKGMENLADIASARLEKMKEVEKWTIAFKKALNDADTALTRVALESLDKLTDDNEIMLCFNNDDEREALALSFYVGVEKRVRKREKVINFARGFFNPFMNSPGEAFELSALSDGRYYKPITSFVLAVGTFLDDFNSLFPVTLKEPAYRYLEKWMPGCIDIIRDNIETLLSDKDESYDNNDDPNGPEALGDLLCALLDDVSFEKSFDYAYDSLKDKLSECMVGYYHNPLHKVIVEGNERVFDMFMSLDGLDGESIERYPVESVYILDRLYEKSILLPGTEKGREAFFNLITFSNPSREILERTIHPSYFENSGRLPYAIACCNRRFSPSNLDILMHDENDINWGSKIDRMPPVGWSIIKNDVERLRSLYFLGANLDWHDEKGNNILHYIYGGRHHRDDMENAIKRVYWLLDEKNRWGSTPCDYINTDKNIAKKYKHLEIQSVWDRIFEKGIGKCAHTVIVDIHSYFDPFPYMERIKEKVVKSTGCSDDTVRTIFTDEELEEFWALSRNSTQSYIAVIHYVVLSDESKRMIYDLLKHDNTTVIAIIITSCNYTIFDTLVSHGVDNLLVRGISTPFESEWYTGLIGAETLGTGEYLFKHGNEVYIAEKDK